MIHEQKYALPLPPSLTFRSSLQVPRLPRHACNIFQLAAQLDDAEPNQSRVQTQRHPHAVLCLYSRIEPHDKVMALGVRGLMLPYPLGKEHGPPVGESPDDAAV